MKYFVISGNPVDGFRYVGPFDSAQMALDYAETIRHHDWWVAELLAPEKETCHGPS